MLHSQAVFSARIVIGFLTVCSFFTTDGFAEKPAKVHPVEAAKAAIKAKNDELALPLLSNFVRDNATNPGAVEARFLLGQVQSRQGHTQQALDNFRLVISSGRDTEWAAKALDITANIHETRRNPTSAQQTRNILLRDYPESSAASPHLWQAASSCFQLSDYRNALRLFDIYLATPYAKHSQEAESMREIAKLGVHGDATAANIRRAELHRNRGEALLSRRLYAQARTNFNDALTHTDSPVFRMEMATYIALCLAMTGEERSANTVLHHESARTPDLIPQLSGYLATHMSDYPELELFAERYLGIALRRFPAAAETGMALLQFATIKATDLKDPMGAIPYFHKFLDTYSESPQSAFAHYQLALALFNTRDAQGAQFHLQQAMTQTPTTSLLSEIEKLMQRVTNSSERMEYLNALCPQERDLYTAKQLHSQRNFSEAARILQNLRNSAIFRRHSRFREALILHAECLGKIGNSVRSTSTYNEVIRLKEDDELAAIALSIIGRNSLQSGVSLQATTNANLLLGFEELPHIAYDFLWKLAVLQIAEGNIEDAKPLLSHCATDRTRPAYQSEALRLLALSDSKSDSYAQLNSPKENVNSAAISIGEGLIESGNMEMAEMLFSRLSDRKISCQPDRVTFSLAAVFLAQEKVDEARRKFEMVISQHPESQFAALAMIRLAIIHTGWLENPQTGRRFLEKVVNDYADSAYRAQALFFLATLYLWEKNNQRSMALFEQLVSEHPDAEEVSYALANIQALKR